MSYSVGQVAGFANVTVRTLHHYDRIGLLSPSGRSAAGYREYADADLDRLQQILFYRELGFALEDIAAILDDPEVDPVDHLRRQHSSLKARAARLHDMIASIERTLEARRMGISMTPEEQFEVFGGNFLGDDYAREAEEKWGGTSEWEQSQQRTAAYTKEDWKRIKAEQDDIERRFAEAIRAGTAPDSEEAMGLAEEQRQHITRWYYDCSLEIHRGLGELCENDPRFRAHYDELEQGLATFLRAAFEANARRAVQG